MNGTPPGNSTRPPARRFLRGLLITLAWLVTLVILFYVEENWRGARAADNFKRRLAAAGEQLDPAAFLPPPVPDDQNFAMTPCLAPLFDFLPGTQKARDPAATARAQSIGNEFKPDRFRAGWQLGKKTGLTDPAAILQELKSLAPTLDELRAASRRPHARFNVRYDTENPWGILLPHLAIIKRLCQILAVRASAELALNQPEPAVQDLQLALRLADSVKDEPMLISHIIRIACLQIVMQPVWEGLAGHHWSEAQLAEVQARLQSSDLFGSLELALNVERAWGSKTIELVRDRRLALNLLAGQSGELQWGGYLRAGPRGWFDQELVNYNRLFGDSLPACFNAETRRVDPKAVAKNTEAIEQTLAGGAKLIARHLVLSRLLLPALGKAFEKFAAGQTTVDEAVLACALERHRLATGRFPENLAVLVPRFLAQLPRDVITGEPLKYHRTDDGRFVLYSVGWNETDDSGTVAKASAQARSPDPKQGDWVWPNPEK